MSIVRATITEEKLSKLVRYVPKDLNERLMLEWDPSVPDAIYVLDYRTGKPIGVFHSDSEAQEFQVLKRYLEEEGWVEQMPEECKACKFLRYCETHNIPCILEAEPEEVIETLEYCPKCDNIVETYHHFSPGGVCFIVVCRQCGSILDHVDCYDWHDWI